MLLNNGELSAEEREKLHNCEGIIERGLTRFVEVGRAILTIRDQRLYRETHSTFEEYCRERLRISPRRAYQLGAAAEVVANLQNVNNCSHSEESASEPSMDDFFNLFHGAGCAPRSWSTIQKANVFCPKSPAIRPPLLRPKTLCRAWQAESTTKPDPSLWLAPVPGSFKYPGLCLRTTKAKDKRVVPGSFNP